MIVADLPYGVMHGSRTGEANLSRSPLQLLRSAIPVWTQLIQPGGTIGISWNTHVASRPRPSRSSRTTVCGSARVAGYDGFAHWVDQSIDRDVLVARKI